MNVSELAEELGLDTKAVLRLCRDRGIRASWEESELSPEAAGQVRRAVSGEVDPTPPRQVAPPVMSPAAPSDGSERSPAAAPAPPGVGFGSVDGRVAAVATETGHDDEHHPFVRHMTPEVPAGARAVVLMVVALAVWWALRYLSDWGHARWWLAAAILAVVAGLAGLYGVVSGVVGASNALRFASARRGVAQSVAIGAVSCVLLLVAATLGTYDWYAIRVPDAYHRLRQTVQERRDETVAGVERTRGTLPTGTLDPEGADISSLKVGSCFDYNDAESISSSMVDSCDSTHTHEVVGFSQFSGTGYPGKGVLVLQSRQQCEGPFVAYVGRPQKTSRYDLVATYPTDPQWKVGIRRGACLANPPRREKGSAKGTDR